MANTLTTVIPQLLAQGMIALRQQSIMARLVNRGFDAIAGEKGSTIDIPIPSAVAVNDVTAAATPPATADQTPTKASITMNKWKEAAFNLSDKDMQEAMDGFIPMQASEAVKALANQIDSDIMDLYIKVYGYAGTAAITPFGTDLSTYLLARKAMADQLAPMDPRYVVLDPTAEANALGLRAFQDASFRGEATGIINGQIGMKLGALWLMDQNVKTHTAGTVAASFIVKSATAHILGLKTLTTTTGGTAALVEGDVLSIAGHTQTYVVTAAASRSGGGDMPVYVEPGLKKALVGDEVITIKDTHTVNMLFHRDAFALAMRPFQGADPMNIGTFQTIIDPVSGLVLRLEVSREYKRTRFAYDVLYGVACPRRELAARIAG